MYKKVSRVFFLFLILKAPTIIVFWLKLVGQSIDSAKC